MAQTGFTPISLYYTTTASAAPTAGNLVAGELAINTTDGKLYYKDTAGVVQVIAGKGGSGVAGGSNTQVQYNSSGSLAGSANMVFDGSTLTTLNTAYTGTLTGGTGVVNLGSGQFYKDASGNVGIGTSSPAAKFEVSTGGGTKLRITSTIDNNADLDFYTNSVQRGLLEGNSAGMFLYSIPSIPIVFGTNNIERMRIDSSGNVGIGTTTTNARLTVTGGVIPNPPTGSVGISGGLTTGRFGTYDAGTLGIIGNAADATSFEIIAGSSGGYYAGMSITGSNATLFQGTVRFATAGTERMRIDSSGNLLVGTTTSSGKLTVSTAASGYIAQLITSSNAADYMAFNNGGGVVGSITRVGGTGVAYNITSDYRLKTDVTPISNALATVEALKPVSFTWVDGRPDDGFLAHEIQAIIPNCVIGEKDAVDKNGKPEYQQMDSSGVIPFLVKAIQELNAEVQSLKQQLGK